MGYFCTFSFFFHLLVVYLLAHVPKTISQPFTYHECVEENGNYTNNSTYQKNLNNLLTSIYTNTEIDYGFYNFSNGEDPDKAYAIALCKPDISPETCRGCVRNASDSLLGICSNVKEAMGGLDDCMVRYASRPIFNRNETGPWFYSYSQNVTSDPVGFNESKVTLLNRLGNEAAAANSPRKYAMGDIEASASRTKSIYALVQCTPDLLGSECTNCLNFALINVSQKEAVFYNKSGGRVVLPSCNFRYEVDRFYTPVSTEPSPVPISPAPPPGPGKSNRLLIIILSVTGAVIGTVILAVIICKFTRTTKKKKSDYLLNDIEEVESLQFDFDTIRTATDDFSDSKKLGQGGFGPVYMGTLPNGQDIAVKRLSKGSGQGEIEFKNEVLLVAKLQHKNLVRLLGFCFEGEERLLVYEFVSNSSLDKFIFDPIRRAGFDWKTRYNIIGGIARGLVYLHEDSRLRIVHRDLKASNILLDEEMKPKISDFGMARLFRVDQTQEDTSRIVGTFGYMAPEYVMRGHFSTKSDVYSFGVLVLEIVSGQKQSGLLIGEQEEDLLTFAWRNLIEGTTLKVMDSTLVDASRDEVIRCIHIGLQCVQESEANRPTMSEVITMLSSNTITLHTPSKPGFFLHAQQLTTPTSRDEHSPQSRNEVSITEMVPR